MIQVQHFLGQQFAVCNDQHLPIKRVNARGAQTGVPHLSFKTAYSNLHHVAFLKHMVRLQIKPGK